jgi:hypothetical protein
MSELSAAKILLAEDDNDMRRFLVRALQQAGYEVVSFDNGLSAYDQLRVEPFELLLTDIVMPEMDGIELARRARPKSSPSPSICAISSMRCSGYWPPEARVSDPSVSDLEPLVQADARRPLARGPSVRYERCKFGI